MYLACSDCGGEYDEIKPRMRVGTDIGEQRPESDRRWAVVWLLREVKGRKTET